MVSREAKEQLCKGALGALGLPLEARGDLEEAMQTLRDERSGAERAYGIAHVLKQYDAAGKCSRAVLRQIGKAVEMTLRHAGGRVLPVADHGQRLLVVAEDLIPLLNEFIVECDRLSGAVVRPGSGRTEWTLEEGPPGWHFALELLSLAARSERKITQQKFFEAVDLAYEAATGNHIDSSKSEVFRRAFTLGSRMFPMTRHLNSIVREMRSPKTSEERRAQLQAERDQVAAQLGRLKSPYPL